MSTPTEYSDHENAIAESSTVTDIIEKDCDNNIIGKRRIKIILIPVASFTAPLPFEPTTFPATRKLIAPKKLRMKKIVKIVDVKNFPFSKRYIGKVVKTIAAAKEKNILPKPKQIIFGSSLKFVGDL